MKAPINFAQKIKSYKLPVGFRNYTLGDSNGADDKMWIHSELGDWNNSLRIDFNWSNNTYTIKVAKKGNGSNFHTITEPQQFHPSWFQSFDTFIQLIQTKLNTDWLKHFIC